MPPLIKTVNYFFGLWTQIRFFSATLLHTETLNQSKHIAKRNTGHELRLHFFSLPFAVE